MWEYLKDLFRENMMQCFYKKHFGMECPGCGTQRAILKLLDGDIVGSFKMYPPLFLILLTCSFLLLHLLFKFKKGATILKFLGILTAIFIFLNYLYKIIL
ncbi:MAG: DUF2752 domain-containing protein [Flavobacteriaceae bacterium]|nr:DUF2752 domain-containing protein [Flavobacteriaceae bacterium]